MTCSYSNLFHGTQGSTCCTMVSSKHCVGLRGISVLASGASLLLLSLVTFVVMGPFSYHFNPSILLLCPYGSFYPFLKYVLPEVPPVCLCGGSAGDSGKWLFLHGAAPGLSWSSLQPCPPGNSGHASRFCLTNLCCFFAPLLRSSVGLLSGR